jgi:hypothetical protein
MFAPKTSHGMGDQEPWLSFREPNPPHLPRKGTRTFKNPWAFSVNPRVLFRTISLVGLLKISIVVQTAELQQFWGGVSL